MKAEGVTPWRPQMTEIELRAFAKFAATLKEDQSPRRRSR